MIHIAVQKALHGVYADMMLDVDFKIEAGEFIALTGQSGSGKSTLLRILAGLEEAQGEINVSGESWLNKEKQLPPQKRRIGFVFQDYALFENMNVLQNLLFIADDKTLALRLLEITGLSEFTKRYPNTLSGGQKQRVSICRAMMRKPSLLLLDEPLSALDPLMRAKLQTEILMLHREFGTTTIMVSHDPSEIFKLASRVLVLENGKLIQDGDVKNILLKTNGSQKFSFSAELLEIKKVDAIFVATLAIGQQLVEVVLSQNEAKNLNVGELVKLSTKAFQPILRS